jgi:hypothetical protein
MPSLKRLLATTMLAAIGSSLSSCSEVGQPRLAILDGTPGDQRNLAPSPDSRWPDDMAPVGDFEELNVFAAVASDDAWCAYGAVPDLPSSPSMRS